MRASRDAHSIVAPCHPFESKKLTTKVRAEAHTIFLELMTKLLGLVVLCVMVIGTLAQPRHERVEQYVSPDGSMIATVTSTSASEATKESRVELRTKSGKFVAQEKYLSEDGEQGYGVTKASWTPDSQFFVYSLESSGGHSPWHSPVQYFKRKQNKILSLDDALNDSVMDPQFTVAAPDKVSVSLWFSKQTLTVSLTNIHAVR